jgi:Transglutaminase-like superfamily
VLLREARGGRPTAEAAPPTAMPATRRAPSTRGLALRAFVAFAVLDVAFRFVSLERLLLQLRRRPFRPAGWSPSAGSAQAGRTFAAVQKATMFYYRRRRDCLPKALATFHLLRRQGLAAELCFGVKKYPFGAHAWVEAYGQPLDDDPPRLAAYTVIQRLSA